jgi:hypothetical protein
VSSSSIPWSFTDVIYPLPPSSLTSPPLPTVTTKLRRFVVRVVYSLPPTLEVTFKYYPLKYWSEVGFHPWHPSALCNNSGGFLGNTCRRGAGFVLNTERILDTNAISTKHLKLRLQYTSVLRHNDISVNRISSHTRHKYMIHLAVTLN